MIRCTWHGMFAPLALVTILVTGSQCIAGTNSFNGRNKNSSTMNITSIDVYHKPGTSVMPPAGWNAAANRGNVTRYVGNIAPGQSSGNFTGNNPNGTAVAVIIGFDYANGKTVGVCPDPVSGIAIPGGPSGGSYLGYSIPANNWGYFYEVWNLSDFTDSTLNTTINIGKFQSISNLAVINNSFSLTTLGQVEPQNPADTQYDFFADYMPQTDALGGPGVATIAGYTAATGALQMTFPNGMTASQVSSVVGFTSSNSPTFTSDENVSSTFVLLGECPKQGYNFTVVPSPEPGTLMLMSAGAAFLLLRAQVRRSRL